MTEIVIGMVLGVVVGLVISLFSEEDDEPTVEHACRRVSDEADLDDLLG